MAEIGLSGYLFVDFIYFIIDESNSTVDEKINLR